MSIPELEDLKREVREMLQNLELVTDAEWRNYIKVRDILASDSDSGLGDLHAGGAFKCAMMGIFETQAGPGQPGEFDAGTVQRFADLGG
ncbi:hypothetical protein EV652_104365 [Kribbella steppae]|uniref:Uncharacterized protein n=1 Tax=Kribbella steppae TaxID=2512223 RepID=A0A4R2HP76_9ACTN|nr:hypothetical protein [Kribbella steppae]TCO32759.1 hypothetical protein EV652_104365 [Kribbella steppae]